MHEHDQTSHVHLILLMLLHMSRKVLDAIGKNSNYARNGKHNKTDSLDQSLCTSPEARASQKLLHNVLCTSGEPVSLSDLLKVSISLIFRRRRASDRLAFSSESARMTFSGTVLESMRKPKMLSTLGSGWASAAASAALGADAKRRRV